MAFILLSENRVFWENAYNVFCQIQEKTQFFDNPIYGTNFLDTVFRLPFSFVRSLTSEIFGENNVDFVYDTAFSLQHPSSNHEIPSPWKQDLPKKRGIYWFWVDLPFENVYEESEETFADFYYRPLVMVKVPLYIGVTDDLSKRFKNHHRLAEIEFLKTIGLEITFNTLMDTELYQLPENLYPLESRLIEVFRPLLNNTPVTPLLKPLPTLTVQQPPQENDRRYSSAQESKGTITSINQDIFTVTYDNGLAFDYPSLECLNHYTDPIDNDIPVPQSVIKSTSGSL
jgi:hypothetical protein